jgi:hypothetical protein
MGTRMPNKQRWGFSTGLPILILLLGPPALGQQDEGQIAGTARDVTGAVLPGVEVAARNISTQLTLVAHSGDSGVYLITPVPVGVYELTMELPGFRRLVQTGVRVEAGTRTTVNATLQLGEIEESVTVSASSAIIQRETAQIGRLVEARQVVDLTLGGRNPIVVPLLKAGVVGGDFSSFNPTSLGGAALSIAGGQRAGNNITFDGVPAVRTRIETSGALVGQLNPDTIQEVQILTGTYRAEYGRAMDGQVRFVTKSGTQNFHGTISHFFRNSALDANTWVRNRSPNVDESRRPAPFRFNQPGYTIGGPVFIPGKFNTDRTKLFFFVSQEWVRWRREQTNTTTVPSEAMRRGDFSELLDPANPFFRRTRVVRDPLTGQPFPGNVIPADRQSRNGMGILNMYPLPTPGFQLGTANLIQTQPNPQDQRKDSLRLDYYFGNQRLTFGGTGYSFKSEDAFRGSFPHGSTEWDRPNYTGRIAWTSTISPRLINEFTFSAANDLVRMYLVDKRSAAGIPLYVRDQYGIDFPYVIPGPKRVENRIPTAAITGFTSIDGSSKPGFSNGPILRWEENMTWMVNPAHNLKFGASFEHAQQNNADQVARTQNGWFVFTDTGHPLATGVAVANVALGVFNDYDEVGTAANTLLRSNSIEAYFQDTWKATPELTLEMGIRYSYHQPWYAKWNDISNFDERFYDPDRRAVVHPVGGYIISGDPFNGIVLPGDGFPPGAEGNALAAGIPGIERLFQGLPRGFAEAPKDAFAPRFGVAYQLSHMTVIRAGAGLFHNRQHHHSGALFRNAPNQPRVDVAYGSVDDPAGGDLRDFPQNMGIVERFMEYPTAFNYSLTVQRELPFGMAVDVGYMGKNGRDLARERNINQMGPGTRQANPGINPNALRPWEGLGALRQFSHTGSSSYHSLQISLDRRFQDGLGFGVSYTFSKTIDDIATPYDSFNIVRSLSVMDRPHLFNYNFIYELPFFRHRGDWVGSWVGGWQITGVTFINSNSPLSVTDTTDVAGVGAGSAAQPWNLVGDPKLSGSRGVGELWFNPAAFQVPAAGTFGNAGLGILRGPTQTSWDLALFKNFRTSERITTQFRLEAYNFPNHPQLDNPTTNPRSGAFGYINSKSGARSLQVGLKLTF